MISYSDALSAVFLEGCVPYIVERLINWRAIFVAQVDFHGAVFAWSSTMAGTDHASIPNPRCRIGYWNFHCVGLFPSISRCLSLCNHSNGPVSSDCVRHRTAFWESQAHRSFGIASNGLGVIGGSTSTLVALGGCTPESKPILPCISTNWYFGTDYVNSTLPHFCTRGVLRSPTMWLGIFLGGCVLLITLHIYNLSFVSRILTTLLMLYRVRGSILIGIFLTSIVSWPRPTPVTYFPYTKDGDALFHYFNKVVSFDGIRMTGNVLTVCQSQNLIIMRTN